MMYRLRGILSMVSMNVSYPLLHYGYFVHSLEETLRSWLDSANFIYFHELRSSGLDSWRRFSKLYQMDLEEDGAQFILILWPRGFSEH